MTSVLALVLFMADVASPGNWILDCALRCSGDFVEGMIPQTIDFWRRRGAGRGLVLAAVLVFAAAGGVGYAKGTERLFGELKEGQSVRVEFSSKGCFHNEAYEFEFRKAPALAVTIVRVDTKRAQVPQISQIELVFPDGWDHLKKADSIKKENAETGRTILGTVNVSDEEAAGLDRLLMFYRAPKKSLQSSTTREEISVTFRDGEKVISEERFSDNSSQTYNMDGLTLFSDLTDKLLGKPKRVVWRRPDPKQEREKAMSVFRNLAGYDRFVESFEITGISVGYSVDEQGNGVPYGFLTQIKAKHPAVIDGASYWIPLAKGEPSPALNLEDFVRTFAAAEAAASRYPWLRDWKNLTEGRSLEVQLMEGMFGVSSRDLETYVKPLWRHAGFLGQPTYSLRGHRNLVSHGSFSIYLSDKDERVLMLSNFGPDPKSPSMLDRVDVRWAPYGKAGEIFSRYAIIEKDGSCRVETFVAEDAR